MPHGEPSARMVSMSNMFSEKKCPDKSIKPENKYGESKSNKPKEYTSSGHSKLTACQEGRIGKHTCTRMDAKDDSVRGKGH